MKNAIILTVLYFVCQFVATLPFVAWHLIQDVPNPMVLNDADELALSLLLASFMMVGHLLFWKDVRLGFRSLVEVPGKMLWVCIPMVLSAMFVLNVFNEWLNLPNWNVNMFKDMSGSVWGVLSIVVGAPVVEEFLFRGGVMNSLHKAGYSSWVVIVVSAVIFGLAHLNPAQMPFSFLLGLLLGWLYYRTGSLIPGILCHFINNSLGVQILRSDYADATMIELSGGMMPLLGGIVVAVIVFGVSLFYARRFLRPVNSSFVSEESVERS